MHNDIPSLPLNNGNQIPQLGLGVFQVDDATDTKNAVKWALKAGYRHIDTAAYYGNEQWVGEAIRESGLKREDVFVTSKLWNSDRGYDQTKAAFQATLDKLGFDYLDMYLIHWPAPGYAESWRAMEDLYKAGKIKNIGVSNFQQSQLETLMKTATVKPVVDQIETHPYFQQNDLHAYLETQGILHEAWSPLGGGKNNALTDPIITELAAAHDVSAAQIILRWHVQREEIVIPKSVHEARIAQNRDIFAFGLDEDEMHQIADLDAGKRVGPNPDDEAWLKQSQSYSGRK
ncbi:aldo/keto reductase [Levilactobacillus spicheri]|uniref:Oxidoreductase n=2 Tax=Levilactobacillus spicheri TaxID=216463 RepID=A0ABQ0WS98_9LACO|nr:aldo/keto reductase [Levilactobacillus spicheri]KRL48076.1 aldo keto reductase [Levilactobacillus spicheri DSM 15429]GEO67664.1 oxidoreductase [Levilactobacillus spicheri]